jgi:hypothetical protein
MNHASLSLADSGYNLWSFGQGVDNHTLEALEYGEWVLVSVEVLGPGETVSKLINITVVDGNTLRYLRVAVTRML